MIEFFILQNIMPNELSLQNYIQNVFCLPLIPKKMEIHLPAGHLQLELEDVLLDVRVVDLET